MYRQSGGARLTCPAFMISAMGASQHSYTPRWGRARAEVAYRQRFAKASVAPCAPCRPSRSIAPAPVNIDLRYLGKSEIQSTPSGATLHFSPNLSRPKVFFDGQLKHPLRFREAVSALHDVVVGDLRFKKKDRTAYEAWKKQQAEEEAELRQTLGDQVKMRELAKIAKEPIPPNLEKDFRRLHRIYWDARVRWANELSRNDPQLFRHLVPCDPVVTVAPDVVFFECFSKDESAYGCLTVDRDALSSGEAGLGTTNVDYSLALYEHFQTLRTYRPTRLLVDPSGFEVKVEGGDD